MPGLLAVVLVQFVPAQEVPAGVNQVAHQSAANAHTPNALNRARLLLDASRWQDAAPVVTAYLQKHPDSGEAHSLMGLILYREHQPRASMAEFLSASQTEVLSAFDLRVFALDCAAIPDYPEAEKWMLRSIDRDDRDAATWEALGHVRYSMQQYETAIEALRHALRLSPHTVSAEALIGLANERLAKPDAAEQAYRTAIEWQAARPVKDAVPYIGLARVLIANNQLADAIPWLIKAANIPPPAAEAHELLGQAYARSGRQAEAAAELEKAVRLEPESARLHLMLARAYRSLGAKEKADAELKEYSKLNGSGAQ